VTDLRYVSSPRIAVGTRVHGRNRWTDERLAGEVVSLSRGIDGRVYAEVRNDAGVPTDRAGGLALAVVDDLRPERIRCRRPELIPDPRHTAGTPQGDGYRCASCGRTIWFIRDGRAEDGERLTHDAWLAEQPGRAF
jgi:hypothetical protein